MRLLNFRTRPTQPNKNADGVSLEIVERLGPGSYQAAKCLFRSDNGLEIFCALYANYRFILERCTENERAMIRERERADRAEAELQERERQR